MSDEECCYRNRFTGQYQTIQDTRPQVGDWVLVHPGRCECEGQFKDDCQEPGDED